MNREAPDGGGGGNLDTQIPGNVSAINEAADWLRKTYAGACEQLASTVYQQRGRAESEWQGEAGEAFTRRATTLAKGADGVADQARAMATKLDELASALSKAQSGMAGVRADASAGGLSIVGYTVMEPGSAPSGDDAGAMTAYNAKVKVWNGCCLDAESVSKAYRESIEEAEKAAEIKRELVHFTGDFVEAGLTGAVKWGGKVQSTILEKQAEEMAAQEEKNLGHLDALTSKDGAPLVGKKQFYELADAAMDARHAQDAAEAGAASAESTSKSMEHGLRVIGAGVTIFATYDEIKHGEDPGKAIVSNSAGFAGGVIGDEAGSFAGGILGDALAGAAIGGVGGSEVPIVGNVVGAVGGLVVGATVGAFTTGAVSAAWDHLSVGSAWHGGVEGVKGLGESIGHGASWVWHHL